MKSKVIIVVLLVIVGGLCIGLIALKDTAARQHDTDVQAIIYSSNQLSQTTTKLDDQTQKAISLEKDLTARKDDITKLSNDLSQATESLTKTEAALKAQQEETAKRDAHITELETKNAALDKESVDLKDSITNLESKITDTKKKLDASEGDKAFLTKELTRLMAEKSELERQFNDLAVLKTQVRKLKEELSVARRLDWIRQGLFANTDQKGASRLMQSGPSSVTTRPASPKTGTNAVDLNVEVNSDGSVKVIPPLKPSTTNAPPAAPQ